MDFGSIKVVCLWRRRRISRKATVEVVTDVLLERSVSLNEIDTRSKVEFQRPVNDGQIRSSQISVL